MFHVKQNKTLKLDNKLAILGENLAVRYLLSKDYSVILRNYLEKTGEIDIICEKNNILYFVEVKSRSVKSLLDVNSSNIGVFEMVTSKKLQKMSNTIELYLLRNKVSHETKWQIMVVGVYIDQIARQTKIILMENVV